MAELRRRRKNERKKKKRVYEKYNVRRENVLCIKTSEKGLAR
jgi:hypothetical protein